MKKKNNKGFTLVELLAVIVVLAVLILIAMPQVLRMMQSAQKSAFVLEANRIVRIGETAYTEDAMTGGMKTRCYTLQELKARGLLSKNLDKYAGKVNIGVVPAAGGEYTISITISISNGSFRINNVRADDVADAGYNPEATTAAADSSCS